MLIALLTKPRIEKIRQDKNDLSTWSVIQPLSGFTRYQLWSDHFFYTPVDIWLKKLLWNRKECSISDFSSQKNSPSIAIEKSSLKIKSQFKLLELLYSFGLNLDSDSISCKSSTCSRASCKMTMESDYCLSKV